MLESFKLSPQQKIQRSDSLWKIDFMFSNYLFYHFSYKCTINFFFFFNVLLFKKKKKTITINTIREVLRPQHFYNIFITNHRWLVVIGSNLNLIPRLLFCPNNNNQ